jgi:hypothetical protein
MRYIETILEPGETVCYQGTVTPWVYGGTVLLCILGFISYLAILGQAGLSTTAEGSLLAHVPFITALFTLFVAPVSFFMAWWQRWTTEISVTDRRVIYKCGFIVRRPFEMNMGKIESVRDFERVYRHNWASDAPF